MRAPARLAEALDASICLEVPTVEVEITAGLIEDLLIALAIVKDDGNVNGDGNGVKIFIAPTSIFSHANLAAIWTSCRAD
jgi:hypothetical protein